MRSNLIFSMSFLESLVGLLLSCTCGFLTVLVGSKSGRMRLSDGANTLTSICKRGARATINAITNLKVNLTASRIGFRIGVHARINKVEGQL